MYKYLCLCIRTCIPVHVYLYVYLFLFVCDCVFTLFVAVFWFVCVSGGDITHCGGLGPVSADRCFS